MTVFLLPPCRWSDVFPELSASPGQGHVGRLPLLSGCKSQSVSCSDHSFTVFHFSADWSSADRSRVPFRSFSANENQPALVQFITVSQHVMQF